MQYLSEHYLKCSVDKHGQCADYSIQPLPLELQKYAAIDGLISRLIHSIICSRLKLPYHYNTNEAPDGLKKGDIVELFLCGKVVALVEIVYIKDKGDGITTKWGKMTVNAGKALVKLVEIIYPSILPPFSFKAVNGSSDSDWNRKDMSLGDIEQSNSKEIVVNTSSLIMPIDRNEDNGCIVEDLKMLGVSSFLTI